MPINRRMDKEIVVHIYSGILVSHKKERNAICSNMDATRDYHTQKEKDKYHMVYRLYVESKKMIQMNLLTKQKQTYRYRK